MDVSAVSAMAWSEVEAQIATAHKFPRSIKKFLSESLTLATLSQDIAEACIFTLFLAPTRRSRVRSVRLAEIVASAYGNMHAASRVVAVERQGRCLAGGRVGPREEPPDLHGDAPEDHGQARQADQRGHDCDDWQRRVVDQASETPSSAVVPRAYVDDLYARIREVAVGNERTLADRRASVFRRLGTMGVHARSHPAPCREGSARGRRPRGARGYPDRPPGRRSKTPTRRRTKLFPSGCALGARDRPRGEAPRSGSLAPRPPQHQARQRPPQTRSRNRKRRHRRPKSWAATGTPKPSR